MERNLKGDKDFSRELSFLFRRSIKIRNSGFAIVSAGLVVLFIGLCVWFYSLNYATLTNFVIDVPVSLIDSSESEGEISVSGFADGIGDLLATAPKYLTGIMGVSFILFTAGKIISGQGLLSVIPSLLVAAFVLGGYSFVVSSLGVLKTDTNSDSTTNVIRKYVVNKEYDMLVKYINESDRPADEEVTMNYLLAQLHLKLDKPDVKLTQNVVESYMSGVFKEDIPVKVRYALEKTALDKTVSPPAISYEKKRLAEALSYSKLSVNCIFVGVSVAFVGTLFTLLGIKIRRRAKFISSH